jgi:hypothetical protein
MLVKRMEQLIQDVRRLRAQYHSPQEIVKIVIGEHNLRRPDGTVPSWVAAVVIHAIEENEGISES